MTAATAGAPPAIADAIRVESIRALYNHARVTLAAAFVIITYMVLTSLPYTPWPIVAAWTVCVLLIQVARELIVRAFFRAAPGAAEIETWARIYTIHQFVTGIVWGATIFLFGHPEEPVTIALVLCCLYSITAASVTSHSYNPITMVAITGPIFVAVFIRLFSTGTFSFIAVGIATLLYAMTMIGYCRVQARTVTEGFRIRFENRELLEALRIEKAEAEGARREAERASLAKSQFLAAASHDLRQPLYALGLFSSSLGSLRLDPEGRTIVGRIQGSISAMESLFVGLLDVSRLDAGVVRPRVGAVSIDGLFDRLSQTFLPIAQERNLDLRFRSDGEWIASDDTLIEQTLANLVSNALRYTREGGVLVAARKRPDGVRLEVWDTGPGIAETDLVRIFEEFVQLDNPGRDRRKGLGLGLSIARRSTALLNAVIAVRSRPGRGSRFSVIQPEAPSAPVERPREPAKVVEPLVAAGADPVLIVDDDGDVRAALGNLLRRWDVAFGEAESAEQALALVDAGARYRLVFTDQRLSGAKTGLDMIDELRRRMSPAPPCVLITGDFDPALIQAAEERGAPLFHKPLRAEKLRELLGLAPLRDAPLPV